MVEKSSKLKQMFDSSKKDITDLDYYNHLKKVKDKPISFMNSGMSTDAKALIDKLAKLEEKELYKIETLQEMTNKVQAN